MSALIRLGAGPALWAAVFAVLYALHGIGCGGGWWAVPVAGTSAHRLVLLAAWMAGSAAGLALALLSGRWNPPERAGDGGGDGGGEGGGGGPLVAPAARWLAWVGFAATAVTGVPVLLVPDCL